MTQKQRWTRALCRTLDPLLPATRGTQSIQPRWVAQRIQEVHGAEEGGETLESNEAPEASKKETDLKVMQILKN